MSLLPFRWDGEALRPLRPRFADREYVVGETYLIEPTLDRSDASHRHQFAWLANAWANLPEAVSDLYPTTEHLRKAALIDAGYFNETILDAGTNAAALRVAAVMRNDDEFARVVVRGPLVVRRTAKSQKRNEMSGKDFQDAKTKVLEIVSTMLGVAPEALTENARSAA